MCRRVSPLAKVGKGLVSFFLIFFVGQDVFLK